jgi:competence protein ComEA
MAKRSTFILVAFVAVSFFCALSGWAATETQQSSTAPSTHSNKKTTTSNASTSDKSSSKQQSSKLDLNTASKEDLDALPGIGDAYAQKIMDGRPYKSKSDLVRKGVLPKSAYDKIRDQVTARQPKDEASENTFGSPPAKGAPNRTAEPETEPSQSARSSSTQSAQLPTEKGMVWVNLDSGIYHREGDRWYGKTKHGKFMSEADAQKAGYRASKTGKVSDSQ